MAKPKKKQLHNPHLKVWNYRGTDDFSSFSPSSILSTDAWLCNATSNVVLDSGQLTIRPGDLVVAIDDDPGALTLANIQAGKWKLIRSITDDELVELANLAYTPPSASLTGGTTLEKHYAATPYSVSLTWSVTEGSNPITTKELQKREGAGVWTKVKDLTGTSGSEDVDVTIDTDTQFRVMVSSKSGEEIYSTTRQVVFQYKVGYRVGAPAPSIDDAWLKAGTLVFDTDEFRSFTANAASGEHIYYYVPKAYVSSPYINPPYFYYQTFGGGFAVYDSEASYEFGDETVEDYVVYRSAQAGLGNTNITVQNS